MQKSKSPRNIHRFSRSFLAFALLIASLTASSQNSQLDRFYDKYHSSSEGINGSFNASFSNDAVSGSEKKGWMNKVTKFRMLVLDSKKTPSLRQECDELAQSLRKDNYDELVTYHKGDENVRVLSKDDKDSLKEIVFLANGKEGHCVFVHIRGHFTAHDIEDVQASLQNSHGKGLQIN